MKNEKYYLKSIFRTILNKPVQPLILIFIFIISFIVLTINFALSKAFKNDEHKKLDSIYGSADIIIKNDNDSGSRFLIKDDFIELLNGSDITGTFEVPLIKDKELFPATAVEFETINNIFDFEFIEYEEFNINEKQDVIFLYSDYCEKNNIKLNDIVEFNCFGVTTSFIVKGISRTPFFGDDYAIVDISRILNSLESKSSYLSLFLDEYNIYGSIYVKLNSLSINEAKNILNAYNSSLTINIVDRNIKSSKDSISNAITFVMIFLSISSCIAVLISTTYCINKNRSLLSNLFYVSGFTRNKLKLYRIIEMVCYSIIGSFIGMSIVYPVCKSIFNIIGFDFVRYEFNILDCIFSFLVLIVTSVIPCLLDKKEKTKIYNQKVNKYLYLFIIFDFIFYITIFFINGKYKFYFTILVLALTFISIFIFTKQIMSFFSKKLIKKEKNIIKSIGLKNTLVVGEIPNLAKLLILLFVIIILACSVILTNIYTTKMADYMINGDYLISSATKDIKNECLNIEGVKDIKGFYFSTSFSTSGNEITIVASESIDNFGKESSYDTLPINNEAYSSYTYADKYGLKVGSTIIINYGGKDYELVIKKLYHGCDYNLLVNIDYIEQEYNYLVVNLNNNIENEKTFEELTSIVSSHMAIITNTNSLFIYLTERQSVYLYFSLTILCIVIIFGAIGVYNNVKQNRIERKDEINYYIIAGFNKKSLKIISHTETRYTVIFTIISSIVIGFLLVIISSLGMHTYGGNLIDSIIKLFSL